MTKRRINTVRSLAGTVVQVAALISVVRKVGPKRIGRLAALATEGYLARATVAAGLTATERDTSTSRGNEGGS